MRGSQYIALNMRRVMVALVEKQRDRGETVDETAIANRDWVKISLAAKRIWHVPDAIVTRAGWVKDWFLLGEYVDPRRAVFARLDHEKTQPKPKAPKRKKPRFSKRERKAHAARKARAAEAQMLRDMGLI